MNSTRSFLSKSPPDENSSRTSKVQSSLNISLDGLLDSMERERIPGCLSKDFRKDKRGYEIRENFLSLAEKTLAETTGFVTVRFCQEDLIEKVGWEVQADILFYGYIPPKNTQKPVFSFLLMDDRLLQTKSITKNYIVAKNGYMSRVFELVEKGLETNLPDNYWPIHDFSVFGGTTNGTLLHIVLSDKELFHFYNPWITLVRTDEKKAPSLRGMDAIEQRLVFNNQSLPCIVSDIFRFQWLKGEQLSDKTLGRRIFRASFSNTGNKKEWDLEV